jgi:hypothetical protein
MYALIRTKNVYFVMPGFFQLMVAVFLTFSKIGPIPLNHGMMKGIQLLLICSAVMAGYSLISKKLKWRGREIFELAARDVEVDPETYTERPKPSGRIVYKRDDLFGFANHYQRKLLGLCRREGSTIVFIPVKMNGWAYVLYHPAFNYKEHTHVTIGFDGSVSTFISKKDYLDYKEDLAFDQLTASLSDLHLVFFDLYQSGQEVRIIDRLNELNINIFT